jgi:hypothetical protein
MVLPYLRSGELVEVLPELEAFADANFGGLSA